MLLNRIVVKELFGMYDYDINLNATEPVSIIAGLNGCGKTTMFNMIDAIINYKYKKLLNINFNTFELYFDTDDYIIVKRRNLTQFGEDVFIFSFSENIESFLKENNNGKPFALHNYLLFETLGEKLTEKLLNIGSKQDDSMFVIPTYSLNFNPEDGIDDITKVIENIFGNVSNDILENAISDCDEEGLIDDGEHQWYEYSYCKTYLIDADVILYNISEYFSVYFISSDRMFKLAEDNNSSHNNRHQLFMNNIIHCSEELQKTLSDIRIEGDKRCYREIMQSFFSNIAVYKNVSKEQVESDISALKNDMIKLINVGMFSVEDEIFNDIYELLKSFKKSKKNDITINYDAVHKSILTLSNALHFYDDIYERITLFLDIVNNRCGFTNKDICIDEYTQKVFAKIISTKYNSEETDDTENKIELDKLSSGEKHLFILFYNLIFKFVNESNKNSTLILIDEPEISLHMVWQCVFVKCLLDVCNHNKTQALIATHSSSIVNDNWRLLIDIGDDSL